MPNQPSHPPSLTILSGGHSAVSDQALCKFARFLGLPAESIPLNEDLTAPPPGLLNAPSGGRILALGQTVLRAIFQQAWFTKLLDDTRFVFVYGFAPGDHDSPELSWLTSGALRSVSCLTEGTRQHFTVHAKVRYDDFPVSGKSFLLTAGSVAVFSGAPAGSGVEAYITVNGHLHFAAVSRGHSYVFMLAGEGLVDIDTVLAQGTSIRRWYAQLVAMSIVLRAAAGPWCWTSPLTSANFIVDDPYLKKRYGFVHYDTLMNELEKTRSALTVAFIPYNHRRSAQQTVDLVRRHSDRFSICVHGCDHTGGEFASLDETWLTGTIGCALDRMEAHSRRAGMPFDNVMVFPQGRFSTQGLRTLDSCGFDAAVNSTPWPVDHAGNPLTIRDLLQIAVTRYENFPVFVRRYPKDIFDYAFDALFQKPVLVVEHHDYFRHGYESFGNIVRDISALKPKPVWMPLGEAVSSCCVLRQVSTNHYRIQHPTRTLRLKNPIQRDIELSFEKPETRESIKAVMINGKEIPFEIKSGKLEYQAHLGVGAELRVAILQHQMGRTKRKFSWKYQLQVTARRMMSDVRDNHLARSTRLLSLAEKMKRVLIGK